jgi:hypothetical protein
MLMRDAWVRFPAGEMTVATINFLSQYLIADHSSRFLLNSLDLRYTVDVEFPPTILDVQKRLAYYVLWRTMAPPHSKWML